MDILIKNDKILILRTSKGFFTYKNNDRNDANNISIRSGLVDASIIILNRVGIVPVRIILSTCDSVPFVKDPTRKQRKNLYNCFEINNFYA